MPDDFAKALEANPNAKGFFEKLFSSLQRYHVGNISGAKTDETRQRRIDKTIELFLADNNGGAAPMGAAPIRIGLTANRDYRLALY